MNGYRSNLKNSNVTVNCTGIVNSEFVELNKLFSFFPNPAKNSLTINPKNLVANINPKNAYQIKGDLSAAHDIFKKLF